MREIACPDCGSVVTYGRLSCAECGSLLASVAGARRRNGQASAVVRPLPDDAPLSSAERVAPIAVDEAASGQPDASFAPPADRDDTAALATGALSDDRGSPEAPIPPEPVAVPASAVVVAPPPRPSRTRRTSPPAVLREWRGPVPATYHGGTGEVAAEPAARPVLPGQEGELASDADVAAPVATHEPEPVSAHPGALEPEPPVGPRPALEQEPPIGPRPALEPEPAPEPDASPAAPTTAGPAAASSPDHRPVAAADLPAEPARLLAGAYLPPSAAFRAAAADPSPTPAWPQPAPGAASPNGVPAVAASPVTLAQPAPRPFGASLLTAAPSPPVATPRPGEASLLSDLPFLAPADTPGWLALAGSVIAAVSFLLPWASSGGQVVGGPVVLGYFDGWGLATVAGASLFLLAVIELVLTVLPSRVPGLVRATLLPLVLAGAYLAVGWVYLGLPYGYGPGVPLVVVGGALLLVGGGLSLRHSTDAPPVL